jgi:tetratricopeptide (TPR) repeat protein
VRAAPDLRLARRLLVTTYLRSGQPAKALATLNDAMGKDGLDPSLFMVAGQAHLQNGDAKTAEEYFAKALRLDPSNARKQTALAVTHLAAAKPTSALDELQNIAESDKGTSADLALISAALRRRDFAAALAAIARLEAKQPDKPLAADLAGVSSWPRKTPRRRARASSRRWRSTPPISRPQRVSLPSTWPKRSRTRPGNDSRSARDQPEKQPGFARARRARCRPRRKHAEVAALVNNAIQANPAEAAPRLLLIELYLGARDSKQALAAAQNAVTMLPNSPGFSMRSAAPNSKPGRRIRPSRRSESWQP